MMPNGVWFAGSGKGVALGAGRNPRGAKGTLKFYLTNNLCIGSTKGSVSNNKPVYSDQCSTGYKVKLV